MNLNEYLSMKDAPSISRLREAMISMGYEVKSDAQIRQWRHGYRGRRPSPENCTGLELVTNGAVTRSEIRPTDFLRIWPELSDSN